MESRLGIKAFIYYSKSTTLELFASILGGPKIDIYSHISLFEYLFEVVSYLGRRPSI